MKITNVRLSQLTGFMEHAGEFWEERLVRPIDIYPEHQTEAARAHAPEPDGRYRIVQCFVEIETDEGVTGLGGPFPADWAAIIARDFRPLLLGEDPRATERVWDKLYRFSVHGRKGVVMQALSAVDCALWDLRGRWAGAPVYRLLGGPTRTTLPCYASMLGFSVEPDRVAARVKEYQAKGFRYQKWFFRHNPREGREGLRRNVALARAVREALGWDQDFMLDCWMSFNVRYVIELAEEIEELRPFWIEEPVLPDLIASCAEIRRAIRIPVATGEHEYTRWGIKLLLDAEACDYVQADTYWAGGISEMQKIIALCSAYDVPVVPHGHSVPANCHLIAAWPQPTTPLVEYLVKWNAINQFFFAEPFVPENGSIALPDRPGIGVDLDETKIAAREELYP
jgi:L-alanine-DL-glutamate epimerase-like enolase superfamily enzyme